MKTLKIGDQVLWRGNFGTAEPQLAKVTGIEITRDGDKYGEPVSAVIWDFVRGRECVVSLDNGHWAYGGQLAPVGD